MLILYLHIKRLFQISIYKTHLSSSELCNITFSQANTSKISWTSIKSHLINTFSLKLAEYSQPYLYFIFIRRLHMLVFNETEPQLLYNFNLVRWTVLQGQNRAEMRKHKDSFAKMLTSLHQSVDFTRELCIPRPLKLASHVISRKPEVLNVFKICFIVIDHSL